MHRISVVLFHTIACPPHKQLRKHNDVNTAYEKSGYKVAIIPRMRNRLGDLRPR